MSDQSGNPGFDIVIGAPGVKQTLDDTEAGLRRVGDAAVESGKGIDENTAKTEQLRAAYQKWRESTDGLTAAQRAMAEMSERERAALDRLMGATAQNTAAIQQSAASKREQMEIARSAAAAIEREREMILAHADAIAIDTRLTQAREAAVRQMAIAQMQAIEMDAAMTAGATAHGFQLGRVNMELGTFIGRLTGANTAATRFAAMLGGSFVGYGTMIAVLAAVAGLAYAYEKLTGSSREAAKAQEEATKALQHWYDVKHAGDAGEFGIQLASNVAELKKQRDRLKILQDELSGPTTDAMGNSLTLDPNALENARKEYEKLSRVVQDGQREVERREIEGFQKARDTMASQLAARIKFNADDADARKKALTMLAEDQRLYQQYLHPPAGQTVDGGAVTAELQRIETLKNALQKADLGPSIRIEAAARNELVDSLTKQLEEMRKVNVEDNKSALLADQNARAAGVQGIAHELLVARFKAENEQLVANATLSGPALAERTKTIQASYDQAKATILSTTAQKDAADMGKLYVEAQKNLADAGARATREVQVQTDAVRKQQDAYDQLSAKLNGELLRGIEQLATRGVQSWTTFFHEVESLSVRLVNTADQALVKLQQDMTDAFAKGQVDRMAIIGQEIASMKQLMTMAAVVGAAMSGASAGYSIGDQTGNSGAGFFGGAATGAMVGNQFLPGWGAAIGGLAGAAGGLLGASHAQSEAAHKQQLAAESFQASLKEWAAQNIGGAASSILSQDRRRREALASQGLTDAGASTIRGADASAITNLILRAVVEHQKEVVGAIDRLYEDSIAKLAGEFWGSIARGLNETNGPAGAFSNALADIEAQYKDNINSASALHATSEQMAQVDELRRRSIEKLILATANLDGVTNSLIDRLVSLTGGTRLDADPFKSIKDAIAQAQTAGASDLEAFLRNQLEWDETFKAYVDKIERDQQEAKRQTAIDAAVAQAQHAILQDQLTTQQKALAVAQQSLQAQQASVQKLQQTVDSLKSFSQSVLVDPSVSILSPGQQLDEARNQFRTLVAQAMTGDAAAASGIPQAAKTLLELSKEYFASSPGYAKDFRDVQAAVTAVTDQFGAQLSTEQLMLKELQKSNDTLQQQVDLLQKQLDATQQNQRRQAADALLATLNSDGVFTADDMDTFTRAFGGTAQSGIQLGINNKNQGYLFGAGSLDYASLGDYWANLYRNTGVEDWPGQYRQYINIAKSKYWGGQVLHDGPDQYGEGSTHFEAFARGGYHRGGWRMVGEFGPELEYTPPSRIFSNPDSRAMLGGSHEVVEAIADLKSEIRGIKQAISLAADIIDSRR